MSTTKWILLITGCHLATALLVFTGFIIVYPESRDKFFPEDSPAIIDTISSSFNDLVSGFTWEDNAAVEVPEAPVIQQARLTPFAPEDEELPETESAESDSAEAVIVPIDHEAIIDSLDALVKQQTRKIEEQEKKIGTLMEQVEGLKSMQVNASTVAKTFAAMKLDEMKPILAKIDDSTAMLIYKNMDGRSRKKFMMGLDTKRAASLTEALINAKQE